MGGEARDSSFDGEQFEAIYPTGVERHYWNRCRNRVTSRHLKAIGARGPMLEVGCGKGLVVVDLRRKGYDITGVDLAAVEPVAEAQPYVRTGVDVMVLDATYCATVRTVLLLDVIEHVEDPVAFIASLRSKFPVLEHLVVTVPARQELFSNYDDFNRHYRRYDMATARAHMDAEGRRIWRAGYFFHALYPAAWLQLKINGARETRFNVPKGALANAAHRLLGLLFRLEYVLLPASWRGTSIIASTQEPAQVRQR